VGLWLRVADVLVLLVAVAGAQVLRFGWAVPSSMQRVSIGTLLLYALLCFAVAPLYRHWRSRSFVRELAMLSMCWLAIFAAFSGHLLLVQMADDVSRTWFAYSFLIGYSGMVAVRFGVKTRLHILRRQGWGQQRVVVLGLRPPVLKLHRYLMACPGLGVGVVGYFASPDDTQFGRRSDLPRCLGTLDTLETYLQTSRHEVDQVWISMPLTGEGDRVKTVLKMLERFPVPVKLVPDIRTFGMLNPSVEQIGRVPVINLRQGLAKGNYQVRKRIEDVILALCAAIVLSPLLLLLALGVKLSSPGPVLFRQRRHGLGGKEFQMLKFRSMHVHQEKSGSLTQATRNDPRVTRFGAFLRRTSLDELPQFFNVLGGSMSVVGPRPHAVQHNNHYEHLIDRYMHRHYVKPGITGWAQVHGLRGEIHELRAMRKRVQYDIDYIRRWSPWLDLKIVVLTVVKVPGQKTAY
jgi:undecaprenyl-phosphate glucose phosphotransferase